MVTPENVQWARRVAKPWRVVFVIYTVALVTGTHWPKLNLSDAPVTDKQIHLFAFGGLTVLLWSTRWLPAGGWLVGLAAAVFGVLDEITQAIPGLHRHASIEDLLINELGVVTALAWIWALRPIGGPPNRLRLAYRSFALFELALRPSAWVSLVLGAGLPAIVVGAWLLLGPDGGEPSSGGSVWLAGVVLGAVGAAFLIVTGLRRRREAARRDDRPCFACGGSCRGASFDQGGWGRCPTCGAVVHRGQWTAAPRLRPLWLVQAMGLAAREALIRLAIMLVAFWVGVVVILPDDLTITPNTVFATALGGIALAGALAVGAYRSAEAQLHDEQAVRCRRCRNDLHVTPAEQGIGRCDECECPFVRVSDGSD